MIYLNAQNLQEIGFDWKQIIKTLDQATNSLIAQDFSQPIKPYLRYKDLTNRIIAMPAYVGGEIDLAGIKWISSFPNNIHVNKLRANSVTILNESHTGIPLCIINTALISGIRTAGVTGIVLAKCLKSRPMKNVTVGMTGFGPIGQLHLQMVDELLGNDAAKYKIFDLKEVDKTTIPAHLLQKIEIVDSWEETYDDADIFITCTVSSASYVNRPPKKGSLQMNVSLRDYQPEFMKHVDYMVVDDWDEVCRENTDIEVMHEKMGLQKSDTLSITEAICSNALDHIKEDEVVMFNPMGMAVYDIAVGRYFYDQAKSKALGTVLE